MERNSYKGDFERFLRDNANQYRMYPSEKVWNGVYKSLHTRNFRFRVAGLVLIFLAVSTGFILLFTNGNRKSINPVTEATGEGTLAPASTGIARLNTADNPAQGATAEQVRKNSGTGIVLTRNSNQPPALAAGVNRIVEASHTLPARQNADPASTDVLTDLPLFTPGLNETIIEAIPAPFHYGPIAALDINRGFLSPISAEKVSDSRLQTLTTGSNIPFINKRKSNINWQLHFTPTVSYRKLTENKHSLTFLTPSGAISYTSLQNINDAVNHKPDIGFEVGIDARLPITSRLKAKAGIQSNVTRYGIRAYSYRSEVATISLNTGNGLSNSVNAISNYRNFSGNSSNWLENLYLQISIPLGFDYTFAKTRKDVQFGFSSSIQPTYLLGKSAYLISADYKNYVKVPDLIRRWNMNADIETFVSYSTGKVKWQVGPQARYQLLSSFVKKYPVKENLFDFGLKVGVSLNNK